MIDETVRRIEELRTQSASLVAVDAAEALRELLDREFRSVEEFERSLERNSRTLRQANRSHAPLYTTQRRLVDAVADADADDVEEAKAALATAIAGVVDRIETSKAAAGEQAAALIDDGDVILTHENSSTVMAALERALADGKSVELYVTESRPRFLGRRTARQLAGNDRVDVTLIVDSAAGHVLPECDRVLVGMNCLIDDAVYNRIGTYGIATAAADRDVPFTVVGASAKFVGDAGFTFENSRRPPSEVLREPADGFDAANPGYDATPLRLVDAVVTEDDVLRF
ncbi:translation initiation factor eIF-2B [Halobaculum lipolyticum]|uniref:Translation initiation factor eIF-2B n=1 Tax=Halobaculum lipolyticum TaxID=3032001 RepID=A0ABD5W6Q5_9EURY|nr:translation initiation factor eIF-2B [Halobaculum sp. DT31]